MPRLATAVKRRKAIYSTHLKHRYWKGIIHRKSRMKSFETEEQAKAWAKAQGFDVKEHLLKELHPGKWQWRKKNPRLA